MIPDSHAEQDAYNELYCYAIAHEDPTFIRQLVVDAWMAQNANEETKPIGLTFALVGLYLHVERGFSGLQVHHAHRTMSRVKKHLAFLSPAQGSRVGHSQYGDGRPARTRTG